MPQPGRIWDGTAYRFGFNGKERDDEVKGAGNSYDYGFRQYDPRVARFLSVDPLTAEYPWYTPYQYAGNMPIWAVDLDGLEPGSPPATPLEPAPRSPERIRGPAEAEGNQGGATFNRRWWQINRTPWVREIDPQARAAELISQWRAEQLAGRPFTNPLVIRPRSIEAEARASVEARASMERASREDLQREPLVPRLRPLPENLIYSRGPVNVRPVDNYQSVISSAFSRKGVSVALEVHRQAMEAKGGGVAPSSGIKTPYDIATQSQSAEAITARIRVAQGATLYRIGTMGKSAAGEAQYWSLEHPLTPGYAQRYGVPQENLVNANFIETAVLKRGVSFVTRPAPEYGTNLGGGIEVVVPEGGVQLQSFSIITNGGQ
jgi:RHS repeat-associated protein